MENSTNQTMLDETSSLREICDFVWDPDDPEMVELKHMWFKLKMGNGLTPKEMMKSPSGLRELKLIILRAIYGVYS